MNKELTRLAIAALRNPDTRFVDEVYEKLTVALSTAMHPGDGHPWTDDDDEFLRKHFKSMQYKAIARAIGRSGTAVRNRVFLLKLEPKTTEWSEVEVVMLKDLGAIEAAKVLGRTLGACRMKLRKVEGRV